VTFHGARLQLELALNDADHECSAKVDQIESALHDYTAAAMRTKILPVSARSVAVCACACAVCGCAFR
jgi:hypothetical protein